MSETTKSSPNHHFIHSSQIFWICPTTSTSYHRDEPSRHIHSFSAHQTVASPPDTNLLPYPNYQPSQDSVLSSVPQSYSNHAVVPYDNVPESTSLAHIVTQVQEQLQQEQTNNQLAFNQDSLILTVDSQDKGNQGPSLKELERTWKGRNTKLTCERIRTLAAKIPSITNCICLSLLLTGITIIATQWPNYGLVAFGVILAVLSALFLLLSLVGYYSEIFVCDTRQYLLFMNPGVDVMNYITQLKESLPYMLVQVKCYHYEDTSGKVVTFTDSQKVQFTTVVDTSLKFEPKNCRKYLQLDLSERIICDDEYSVQFIEKTKNQVERMHRFRDKFTTVETELCMDGYRPQLMFDVQPNRFSFMVGLGWFWLFSVLGLTLPYRHLVNMQSSQQYYTIRKRVSFENKQDEKDTTTSA